MLVTSAQLNVKDDAEAQLLVLNFEIDLRDTNKHPFPSEKLLKAHLRFLLKVHFWPSLLRGLYHAAK